MPQALLTNSASADCLANGYIVRYILVAMSSCLVLLPTSAALQLRSWALNAELLAAC